MAKVSGMYCLRSGSKHLWVLVSHDDTLQLVLQLLTSTSAILISSPYSMSQKMCIVFGTGGCLDCFLETLALIAMSVSLALFSSCSSRCSSDLLPLFVGVGTVRAGIWAADAVVSVSHNYASAMQNWNSCFSCNSSMQLSIRKCGAAYIPPTSVDVENLESGTITQGDWHIEGSSRYVPYVSRESEDITWMPNQFKTTVRITSRMKDKCHGRGKLLADKYTCLHISCPRFCS